MISLKKKLLIAAAIITMVALTALVTARNRATPEESLPDPNGYEDFLQAAALLVGNEANWPEVSNAELRSMVASNQPALALIRVGLTKQCRVIPKPMTTITNSHLDELAAAKRIAIAFAAASRLALVDGRTNEAAHLAIDCIRYGTALPHGGVIIDALVGIADQYIGRKSLEEAMPGTDAETSRQIVSSLDRVINEGDSCADVFKREAQWARLGRFGPTSFFNRLLQPFLQRDMKKKAEQKFARSLIDLQQTKLRAAAHAYELDHGKPPAARELVPRYLKSVPLNATNGVEMQLN